MEILETIQGKTNWKMQKNNGNMKKKMEKLKKG